MRPAKRISKLTTTRATGVTTEKSVNAKILTAGTIPWRTKNGQLQVLLIHRPVVDDWSWPKGRLSTNETLPETAWRETKEEIGLDLPLGIPLGVVQHKNSNGKNRKEVWYWAVQVKDQQPAPDAQEVDDVRWVTVDDARKELTKPHDLAPLEVLAQAYADHQLATTPFLVLRQAKPTPAEAWTQDEVDRPLADSGYAQAKAAARLLRAWRPRRIIISTYLRSLETVAPLVKRQGGSLRIKKWLNVKTLKRRPKYFLRQLDQEFKRSESTVVCSQPGVIKRVLANFHARVREADTPIPPKFVASKKKPNLPPAGLLVVHRAKHLKGRIVSVERYEPIVK